MGRAITLNDRSWTIVGVAPRGFRGSLLDWYGDSPIDIFVPLWTFDQHALVERRGVSFLTDRELRVAQAIGRLKAGTSFDEARTALTTRARLLERTYPATNDGRELLVRPGQQARFWPGRYADSVRLLFLLNGSTALLLIVACFNLANLFLTRALSRQRETAVRLALGAGRLRVMRQLLVEVLLLALCGAALGLGVATTFTTALEAYPTPFGVPLYQDLDLDGRALAFTLGLSLVTGLAFGLVPAIVASRGSLVSALRAQKLGLGSSRRIGGRQVLVVGQIAASIVVLAAASLLGQSLFQLSRIDLGYNPDNLLMAQVDGSQITFGDDECARRRRGRGSAAVRRIWLSETSARSTC